MKILLISASFEDSHREKGIHMDSHYPLGLGYLHAVLEKEHEARTLFLNDYKYHECALTVCNFLATFKPDVVGFNMLTPNRWMTYQLMQYIHYTYPQVNIMLGGIHATVMANQLFEQFPYVVIVKGEAEISFPKLLDAKPGIYDGDMPMDLDALPFLKHEVFWNPQRTTACLLTSRGCPFQCNFCVIRNISQRKVRYRSPENIVAEIEYLIKISPNLQRFWIHDDAFTLNEQRTIDICKLIIKKGLNNYIYICSARVKPISDKMLSIMEQAGFRHILFGLETGCKQMMATNGKKITQEDVIKCHKLMAKRNILATYFLIAGLPGETDKTVDETIAFIQYLQKIKPIRYEDIGMALVYPGTELYKNMLKSGKMKDDDWLTEIQTPYYTAEHSLEEMTRLKNKLLEGIR